MSQACTCLITPSFCQTAISCLFTLLSEYIYVVPNDREGERYCLRTKHTESMSLWNKESMDLQRMTSIPSNFSSLKPACLSLTQGNVCIAFPSPLRLLTLAQRGCRVFYIVHYRCWVGQANFYGKYCSLQGKYSRCWSTSLLFRHETICQLINQSIDIELINIHQNISFQKQLFPTPTRILIKTLPPL